MAGSLAPIDPLTFLVFVAAIICLVCPRLVGRVDPDAQKLSGG
jgi:hypothetical protein